MNISKHEKMNSEKNIDNDNIGHDEISVKSKTVYENEKKMKNTEIGISNVRTESVLLSGSAGSGLSYLAIGVAQKVRRYKERRGGRERMRE